jgi:hypothetical protein
MELAIIEHDGEPRVRDIEIAERLGMERPSNVRVLIERHLPEMERFGVCTTAVQTSGVKGGRPSTGYLLNEEQALLVATLSRAPRAADVREALIRTFVAWRRGRLPAPAGMTDADVKRLGGVIKAVVHRQLEEALPAMLTAELERDPRHVAIGYVPALEVLKQRKVPAKGRRPLSQRISALMRRLAIRNGFAVRMSRETGRYLYPPEAVTAWLAHEGDAIIRDHMASLTGQGRLHLVRT